MGNNWDIAHCCPRRVSCTLLFYSEAMSGERHLLFLLSSGDVSINLSVERQGMGVEDSGEILS